MKLFRVAKLLKMPDELPDRAHELLDAHAEEFVRAGGQPTLTEWLELNGDERAAIIRARDKIEAERAFRISMASRSALGAAQVFSAVDNGHALAQVYLEDGLDRAIANFHG